MAKPKTQRKYRGKLVDAKLPFGGFYGSVHSENLDYALKQLTTDDTGCHQLEYKDADGETVTPGETLWEHVDYSKVHLQYAQDYVQAFNAKFLEHVGEELNAQFDELTSPREYNFATDRIFVKIPLKVVKALWAKVDREALDKHIAAEYTSRSGFISHYANSLAAWLADKLVTQWDHNQIGTLLETVLGQAYTGENLDSDIAEDLAEDGGLENVLCGALDAEGNALLNEADKQRGAQEYFQTHQQSLNLGSAQ